MPRFVALLRGVNIGKAKRVPMADLRALMARLGYTDVATLLNSGNAVFTAPGGAPAKHAQAIAAAIAQRLEVEVPVVVVQAKDLAAIVAQNPLKLKDDERSRCLVAFTQDSRALAGLAAIRPLVVPPERLVLGTHAAYVFLANGILTSKAGGALLGRAGSAATTRNWATTLKLNAMANGGDV